MDKRKPIYGYDVYYRFITPCCLLVAAHNQKEAKEEALRQINEMSRDELIDRFLAALNYDPSIQITYVDRVDKLEEEDLQ